MYQISETDSKLLSNSDGILLCHHEIVLHTQLRFTEKKKKKKHRSIVADRSDETMQINRICHRSPGAPVA